MTPLGQGGVEANLLPAVAGRCLIPRTVKGNPTTLLRPAGIARLSKTARRTGLQIHRLVSSPGCNENPNAFNSRRARQFRATNPEPLQNRYSGASAKPW